MVQRIEGHYIRYHWKILTVKQYSDVLQERNYLTTIISRNRQTNDGKKEWCKYIPQIIDAKSFQTYDKEQKRIVNFNPSIYAALVVTASAFNGRIDNLGAIAYANLRQILDPKIRHMCGHQVGDFYVTAPNFDPKRQLKDLIAHFRTRLDHYKKPESLAKCLKAFSVPFPQITNTHAMRVASSSIGLIKVPEPVTDIYVQQSQMYEGFPPYIGPFVFQRDVCGRHEVIIRIEYSPTMISDAEANIWASSLKYFLQEVPIDISLENAVEAVEKFINRQRTIYGVK